jgi:hypothetical protein
MKKLLITLLVVAVGGFAPLEAYIPDDLQGERNRQQSSTAQYRTDCALATAQVDLNVNNVRARLMTGGDMWWNLSDARYVVPNVQPPMPEVSSIFAGAVWIGGFDLEGNLKIAAQSYRRSTANDFWPGPLRPEDGTTDATRCRDWDRFFRVTSEDIEEHKRNIASFIEQGLDYPPEMIPANIKYWPALGNPFFNERYDFELPFNDQGLGNYFDYEGNGIYDPSQGDYPRIDIRGCEPGFDTRDPDEMFFYIYNDAGGTKTRTGTDPVRMEVQVQAFAYSTQDEINNMTFYRHKLINRSRVIIDSMYFAMWVDPDLGCPFDDYIGCDTALDLMYVYNEDAIDGTVGCDCPSGGGPIPTYCRNIPALGVDYFRGPLNEFGEEIGMSSFVYYNNPSGFTGSSNMTDPLSGPEFYNYLTGSWRDGTPFTFGGSGYRPSGGVPINYAFTEPPDDSDGWSMCTAGLEFADRRTLQASGPFRLIPGAVNELIVGVVWVPDIPHPCPDLTRLFNADRTAQALFDNCFDFPRGPDAPDMFVIELDQELIFTLANDTLTSNNAFLEYEEKGLRIPDGEPDSMYVFEGYQVFQLRNSNVEPIRESFENASLARLVFQVDVRNDVSTIYNWEGIVDPNSTESIWVPKQMVAGRNQGIRHSFRIDEDLFADEDRTLINHKKYYFAAVAYGHNDFLPLDFRTGDGQEEPYLEGNRNVRVYTVTPRPTVYKNLNADYGDGVPITRLEGRGTGRNFVQLEDGIREAIVDGTFDGELRYAPGGGPIDVQIYNPLDVVDGEYELTFFDDEPDTDELAPGARWRVTHLGTGESVVSETSIDILNENLVGKFGFSVTLGQEIPPGTDPFVTPDNGFLGGEIVYEDPLGPEWLFFVPEEGPGPEGIPSILDYIKTERDNDDFDLDPERAFVNLNETGFYPYCLFDYRTGNLPMLTAGWLNSQNVAACAGTTGGISRVNNVDIVFTSDRSKWSRVMVVESASREHDGTGLNWRGNSMFDLIDRPAATIEAGPDGLPMDDPDADPGLAWFPGYAIDVETGKRLNLFFAENTIYSPDNPSGLVNNLDEEYLIGDDRIWNPSGDFITGELPGFADFILGGQHYIYVTNEEYDGCQRLRDLLAGPLPTSIKKPQVLQRVTWAAMPVTSTLLSYEDGLIPNDAVVQLRVTQPYEVGEREEGGEKAYNSYFFKIEGKQADDLVEAEFDNALDQIDVVPNPYYAYSAFEESQFDNNVRITNLPDQATVTIYTLDGKFIRRYERNVSRGGEAMLNNTPPTQGRLPSSGLNWDLRNHRGIPVASGVYLIHVEAPGLGERVIKWFGIARQFDPSGL